jgi:hypothetical protein
MPRIDCFFDDDYFVQNQDFFYKSPKDMAEFGALMDKFAGQMYDLDGWRIVGVNAQNEYARTTSRIKSYVLFPPPLDGRSQPCQVR